MAKPDITDLLKRHAKRFGIEGIAETAAECGFSVEQLAELIEWLDTEEYSQQLKTSSQYTPDKKRHRKSYETRAKEFLGITEEDEQSE